MIPQIQTIQKGEDISQLVEEYAKKYEIAASHRIVVIPEKSELSVEQIHVVQKDIQVSFSKPVLVVLVGVDDSSAEVQNSLLKSIEEDSGRILFLLLVTNPVRLLPTILSRCSLIAPRANSKDAQQIEADIPSFSFQDNSDVKKEEAVERIDRYIQSSNLRDNPTLKFLLTTRKLIIDNNMNPILALDSILIFLSKRSTMKVNHENT